MSARETFLAHARSILWRTWSTSPEELASAAVDTLMGLGMLVPEGGAAELERLRLLTNAQPASFTEEQLGALIDKPCGRELSTGQPCPDHPRPSTASEPAHAENVSAQVQRLRTLLAGQRAAVEDPHDSPLHHTYRLGHDLPEAPSV